MNRLTNQEIYQLKDKISKVCRVSKSSISLFGNNKFEIHNVDESDARRIQQILSKEPEFKEVMVTSGKPDFSKLDFKRGISAPKQFKNVIGTFLKEGKEMNLNETASLTASIDSIWQEMNKLSNNLSVLLDDAINQVDQKLSEGDDHLYEFYKDIAKSLDEYKTSVDRLSTLTTDTLDSYIDDELSKYSDYDDEIPEDNFLKGIGVDNTFTDKEDTNEI